MDYSFNTKSSDYRLCIFVSYRYKNVNFTEGRCPGGKGMVFGEEKSNAILPNVNIGDCDYTIAFWIRFNHSNNLAVISGSPRSGNFLFLILNNDLVEICDEVMLDKKCVDVGSSRVAMYNWTHIAVTCEQDNGFKMFFNGELARLPKPGNADLRIWAAYLDRPPKETFSVVLPWDLPLSRFLIMDLHILGFALPPDKIYDLNRGKQIVKMNFLFYEKME